MRFWRMIAIVIVGIGLGLGWNAASGRGFALSRNAFLRPGDQLVEIPAAEAKQRLEQGALVLDARGWEFYKMGHIPGALNLPEEDFDRAFAKLEPRLRGSYDIVVYCAGYGCEASHIVTRKLKERGVHAVILNEGWPAWEDAGYPTREGEQP
jgi:ArsR family transcriptional regulator